MLPKYQTNKVLTNDGSRVQLVCAAQELSFILLRELCHSFGYEVNLRAVTTKKSVFSIMKQFIEHKERQRKNTARRRKVQARPDSAGNQARKCNNKIWKTQVSEQGPQLAFRSTFAIAKNKFSPGNVFLTPNYNSMREVWYKAVPVGRNSVAQFMKQRAATTIFWKERYSIQVARKPQSKPRGATLELIGHKD